MKARLSSWFEKLGNTGILPSDDGEDRLCKAILTYCATLIWFLSFIWVITYFLLERPRQSLERFIKPMVPQRSLA